jgi:hypothetical protein
MHRLYSHLVFAFFRGPPRDGTWIREDHSIEKEMKGKHRKEGWRADTQRPTGWVGSEFKRFLTYIV